MAAAAESGPERPASGLPSSEHPRAYQVAFGLIALALALVTLYLMRDVIGAFVLGAVLAFLVGPVVDQLERLAVPRSAAILLTFALVIALVAALFTMVAPLLTEEIGQLRVQAPAIAATAQAQLSRIEGHPLNVLGVSIDLSGSASTIEAHANEFLLGQFGNALSLGLAAISTLLQTLLMLIVAFLLALDAHRVSRLLRRLTPTAYRADFDEIWPEVKSMVYAYMRGQLTIAALIGISTGIAIELLGLKFALALGLLAGIASLVPYLGPVLGAVPTILIGLAASPRQAVLVGLSYLVITNLILNFVYPKVVGDAVRLRPIFVIVAFIAGFSLAGILGMFVAVPIAATIRILFDHVHPKLFGGGESAPATP